MDNRQMIIAEVAAALGVKNPEWLAKLISFETAGTFNPTIKNPTSSARGLIQFMNATARNMGFADSSDLVKQYPDFESQMKGPVKNYLSQWGNYPTEQSLYMSVFYPRYRNAPPDTAFSDTVRQANPGINKVSDYTNKVSGRRLPKWWQTKPTTPPIWNPRTHPYEPPDTSTTPGWLKALIGIVTFSAVRSLLSGRGKGGRK